MPKMNVYFITPNFSLMKPLCDMSRVVSSDLVGMVIIWNFQSWCTWSIPIWQNEDCSDLKIVHSFEINYYQVDKKAEFLL